MYQVTITNTFPSESDCDMFIMVLQQQWPSFMDRLPGATLRIFPVSYTHLTLPTIVGV